MLNAFVYKAKTKLFKLVLVRSGRATSNCSGEDKAPDLDEIFNELERWHDILKDLDKSFLRGPRP